MKRPISVCLLKPDRLAAIRDYTDDGGGLVIVGGYLTFQGIDGKARYAGTAAEEALPVLLQGADDRVEAPSGVKPRVTAADHPIVADLPTDLPNLLGYNRVMLKPGADLVASVGDDPLIAADTFGSGRSVAFTSDCGPHWCPPPFVAWEGYATMWENLVQRAATGRASRPRSCRQGWSLPSLAADPTLGASEHPSALMHRRQTSTAADGRWQPR